MTPKHAACFLPVKGDLMSKMLDRYVFDMQLFNKSEFGWVEKQYQYSQSRAVTWYLVLKVCLKKINT